MGVIGLLSASGEPAPLRSGLGKNQENPLLYGRGSVWFAAWFGLPYCTVCDDVPEGSTAMRLFSALNRLPFFTRWPLKGGILVATVFFVCFPNVAQFVRHVQRWRNPNALVEPDAAALAPLAAELRERLSPDQSPADALRVVQALVYEKIEYEWDWVNWGNVDYIPTVTEAILKGREDCDGQAVVAASLLRRLGYQADLVTDFSHVWVRTEYGDTMSPGTQTAIVAQDGGLSIQPDALLQLPGALGFGLSVFYLDRELVIVLAIWLMMIRPGRKWWRNALALGMLVGGLMLIRKGGAGWTVPYVGAEPSGVAVMVLAWVVASSLWQTDRGAVSGADGAPGITAPD